MSNSVRPPGSSVPGILQARTLEWVAIPFSNAWKWKVKVKSLSCIQLFMNLWTAAYQAPPSMGFFRQEYWSGMPLLSPISLLPTTKELVDLRGSFLVFLNLFYNLRIREYICFTSIRNILLGSIIRMENIWKMKILLVERIVWRWCPGWWESGSIKKFLYCRC